MPKYYYKRYSRIKTDVMREAVGDAVGMSPSHLILCIHVKSQLDQGNGIIDALPEKLVRSLKNQNTGTYQGIPVYLLTDKISPDCEAGGVAIASFINLKLLPRIEASNPDSIIYIPWKENDLPVYTALPDAEEI